MDNLKELRESKSWSREQLAVKMKVSVVTIYNWERGLRMHKKYERELELIFKV